MATLAQGQAVKLHCAISQEITVTPSTGGRATISANGPGNVSYAQKTISAAETFGPYLSDTDVVIAAVAGSLSYDLGTASLVDGAGNVALTIKTAAPLPVLETFGRISEWSVVASGGTFATSSSPGVLKPACINMATPAVSAKSAYGTKNIKFNLNAHPGFWVYLRANLRTDLTSPNVTLYASPLTNLGAGNRWTYVFPNETTQYVGTQAMWIPKAAWTALDGAPSWADDMLSIRVRIDSSNLAARDVDLFGIMLGASDPTVLFTLDDNVDSGYSIGWVEARKRNIPLSHFVIPNLIGTTNYSTLAQLQEMKASGDYMGLHGADRWSDDLSRIAADKAALLATGLSDCKHSAIPEGALGAGAEWLGVKNALIAVGVQSSRLAAGCQTPCLPGYTDPYTLPAYPLNNLMTLTQAKAAIDTAKLSGGTVIFYGHKFGGTADSTTWTTSDWTELLDYVNTSRIDKSLKVTTIDKWFDQRYVS